MGFPRSRFHNKDAVQAVNLGWDPRRHNRAVGSGAGMGRQPIEGVFKSSLWVIGDWILLLQGPTSLDTCLRVTCLRVRDWGMYKSPRQSSAEGTSRSISTLTLLTCHKPEQGGLWGQSSPWAKAG